MATSNSSGLQDVKSVFTRWAPRYDLTHALLPYRAAACRALDLRPGERVLDLGCGTGLNLAGLRRSVGAAGEVLGADLTPAMLEVARRRVARHGWTNVHLIAGDAAHLTFGDGSFDKILVAFSLYIIPDHEAAISEIQRVLRPGGRFVDLETGPPERGPWQGWNARHPGLAHTCRVDFTHDVPGALGRVFPHVELRRRMAGWFVLAVCDK